MWVACFQRGLFCGLCSFSHCRYKDGQDHIGEHRDDERELAPGSPIASVSFGACRDFFFRHKDSRGKHPLPEAGGGQAPAGPWQLTHDEPPDQHSLVPQSPGPKEGSGSPGQPDISENPAYYKVNSVVNSECFCWLLRAPLLEGAAVSFTNREHGTGFTQAQGFLRVQRRTQRKRTLVSYW